LKNLFGGFVHTRSMGILHMQNFEFGASFL